jgi:hypothetical protein
MAGRDGTRTPPGGREVTTVVAIVRRQRGRPDPEVWARAKTPAPQAAVVGWTAMVADQSQDLVGGGDPAAQGAVVVHLDRRLGPLPDAAALFPDLAVEAYDVDERLQWDRVGDWPEGARSPGFARVALPRRRDDRDAAFFARWWSEVHAPLAHRHHPGIARYVQHRVLGPWPASVPAERGSPDGIAEMHFVSSSDFTERMYDSPDGRRITRADVATCLDPARGERFLLGRWLVRRPPPADARFD